MSQEQEHSKEDSQYGFTIQQKPSSSVQILMGKAMRKRILHYEDDRMLSQMYQSYFERDGLRYAARVTPSPDPVAFVKSFEPDLILMSVIMPEMDGFTATALLKKDQATRSIPVVFLTNLSQMEDIEKGKSLGAVDYLVSAKCTPSQVVNRVRELLGLPKLKREKKHYSPLPVRGSRVPSFQEIPEDEAINRTAE